MASRVLFDAYGYVACVTRAGLTIQNKRTGKGRLLPWSDPDCAQWIEVIESAIDDREAADLASSIYAA